MTAAHGASGPSRSPGLLVLAGAIGLVLFGATFLSASYSAIQSIDNASIAAETARAKTALHAALSGNAAFDAGAARRLGHDYGLDDARLVEAGTLTPDEVSVPIPAGDAAAKAPPLFAWTPRRYASETFASVAPLRIGSALGILAVLAFILHRLFRVARDLEARRAAARALAGRDTLTGLNNRLAFEEELHAAFAGGAAPDRSLALFYLDLDDFKPVNDTFGHAAGDQLLRVVGERLTALAGEGDSVARLGGDEFAIIRRNGLSRGDLADFANRIHLSLCRRYPIGDAEVEVGVSMGIAILPDHAATAEQLVREADAALYRAKARAGAHFLCAAPREALPAAGAASRHAA